jgi:hypothetical protein
VENHHDTAGSVTGSVWVRSAPAEVILRQDLVDCSAARAGAFSLTALHSSFVPDVLLSERL